MEVAYLLESLKTFLIPAVHLAVFIVIVVWAALNLRTFKKHYKTGLVVALICFALIAPSSVFSMIYFF